MGKKKSKKNQTKKTKKVAEDKEAKVEVKKFNIKLSDGEREPIVGSLKFCTSEGKMIRIRKFIERNEFGEDIYEAEIAVGPDKGRVFKVGGFDI